MSNLGLYAAAFGFASIKFLLAASFMNATVLTDMEIFLSTCAGAVFTFSLFYWSSESFIKRSHLKRIEAIKSGTKKKRKAFTKVNKFLVRMKISKTGFWSICILGPLFLTVPIGGIVVAKFYGEDNRSYFIGAISLIITSFLLAYLNGFIFDLFK